MGDFPFENDDEVFNKVTRAVGKVINVKEIDGLQYLRVLFGENIPDQVWPASECELWHKKR
jgi:hypothetical protein